ncbi:hypothetical protein Tco_1224671 [Tanacetum coccineum]
MWKNLNGDALEAFISKVAEGVSTQAEAISASDADTMWNIMACIIKTHTIRRESWWLCEDVQSKVTVKQARFREFLSCREGNQEERLKAQEKYKEAKKEAKKAVAQAKEKAGPEGREEAVDPSIQPQFECYYSRISQAEVRTALQKMGRNKA